MPEVLAGMLGVQLLVWGGVGRCLWSLRDEVSALREKVANLSERLNKLSSDLGVSDA